MRGRAQQPLLKVLPESVINRKRDNERRDTSGNAENRNASDNAYECLTPLGAEIAACDEKFESH